MGSDMFYTIYKITNNINGKCYIGAHQTTNLNDEYLGSGTVIKRAVAKYGPSAFTKKILYIFNSSEEMFKREKELVDEAFINNPNTYNCFPGGQGGFPKGMTAWNKGKQLSPEHCQILSDAHKGKLPSKETRRKMSETRKGRKLSKETRRKMSDAAKKRKVDETKMQKMWETRRGNSHTTEARQKIAQSKIGRKRVYLSDGSWIMVKP